MGEACLCWLLEGVRLSAPFVQIQQCGQRAGYQEMSMM